MKDLIRDILKEETQDIDEKILIFLKRRSKIEDREIGDENSIKIRTVYFDVDGDWYNINSWMSKKDMKYKILNMLEDNDIINLGQYDPKILNTDRQKVIRTIKYFIDKVFPKKD
jgi:hypothetical protein